MTGGYRRIFDNNTETVHINLIDLEGVSNNIKVKMDEDYLAYVRANLNIAGCSGLALNLFYQTDWGQHDYLAHT